MKVVLKFSNVRTGETGLIVRMKTLGEGDHTALEALLQKDPAYKASIERLSSVGPSVGEELRRKTVIAIILVVLMIILHCIYLPQSFKAGVIMDVRNRCYHHTPSRHHHSNRCLCSPGHFSGLEADTLFVVALLTILGLSVNDTIVVFDRIRENLRLNKEQSSREEFAETVGKSLEQTYVRSFNTSFTVILVLFFDSLLPWRTNNSQLHAHTPCGTGCRNILFNLHCIATSCCDCGNVRKSHSIQADVFFDRRRIVLKIFAGPDFGNPLMWVGSLLLSLLLADILRRLRSSEVGRIPEEKMESVERGELVDPSSVLHRRTGQGSH